MTARRGVAYVQHCLCPAIEISVGDILSSWMGAVPIPGDKKMGCIVTMTMTKNDLMNVQIENKVIVV